MASWVHSPSTLCYPHKVTVITIINPVNCWPARVCAIHSALFKLSGKLALPKSERGNYLNRLRSPIRNSSPWLIHRPPAYILRLFPFLSQCFSASCQILLLLASLGLLQYTLQYLRAWISWGFCISINIILVKLILRPISKHYMKMAPFFNPLLRELLHKPNKNV